MYKGVGEEVKYFVEVIQMFIATNCVGLVVFRHFASELSII